jgi:hypothetical protein
MNLLNQDNILVVNRQQQQKIFSLNYDVIYLRFKIF